MKGFIGLCAVVVLTGCATAHTARPPVTKLAILPMPASYQPSPETMDMPVTQVLGTAEQIFRTIKLAAGPRGEFETIPDYEQRISSTFTGKISFVEPLSAPSIKFDPYDGSITLQKEFYDAYDFGYRPNGSAVSAYKKFYPTTIIGEAISSQGVFDGQNSYGAKASIERRKVDRAFLVFEHSIHRNPGAPSGVVGSFEITAAELQAEKSNIALVYDVTFESPYLIAHTVHGTTTIQNPYMDEVTNYFIRANIVSVSLINQTTGKLYRSALKIERNHLWL